MKSLWLRQQKPVTHADKALEYVEKALAIVQERSAAISEASIASSESDGAYEGMFYSMINQIQYVITVLTKPNTDRSRLHDISLGNFAAKEFDGVDPELCEALSNVNYIAYQIGHGLKIDLHVLEKSR